MQIRPVRWDGDALVLIDQTQLPHRYVEVRYTDWRDVAQAIRQMVVRGAPAIGAAAACGLVLAAQSIPVAEMADFRAEWLRAADVFASTRPTAVNLFWAIERMKRVLHTCHTPESARRRLRQESEAILEEDVQANRAIGQHGQTLIPDGARILTHCNAGALATVGYGTALGVIRAAVEAGKKVHVYADETRPRLQGMQLTAWELVQEGIPVTVITDNMAGMLMRRGEIDVVVVGADRIAANGDVANKVGTYSVAVLAKFHGIPLYVAAPISTIDLSVADGSGIPIEERAPEEVTHIAGVRIAPEGVRVINPAFDVTPAELVQAIITEEGIARPPYTVSLAQMVAKRSGEVFGDGGTAG
ncbi:MAG: S-methyl-5-thioribose-1-phosphate isomerase [Chthonomonadetes bacterium]|nr:S-methyl-5-thioribose-1-phosphate isomerase [Chthonomonadetes bacterium]